MRSSAAIAASLLASCTAFAGGEAPRALAPRFVSVTFENDFFVGFDRHCTTGVQAALLADRQSCWRLATASSRPKSPTPSRS